VSKVYDFFSDIGDKELIMRRGFYFGTSLVFVFLLVVPIFAQGIVISERQNYGRTETISIDDFDTADGQDYLWTTTASQFITEGYPRLQNLQADGTGSFKAQEPYALRNYLPDREQKQILGVQVKYNRKADNWFELYPVPATGATNVDGSPFYGIPLEGRVVQLDAWVWGSGFNFSLECVLRDAIGRIHVIPAGKLNFNGWKNVIISIPSNIKQSARPRSGFESLYFVGFRVRSAPTESVANFTVYLDHLQYTTYRDSNFFDGFELLSVDFDESSAVTPPRQEAAQ
jgi:hypothetical protein